MSLELRIALTHRSIEEVREIFFFLALISLASGSLPNLHTISLCHRDAMHCPIRLFSRDLGDENHDSAAFVGASAQLASASCALKARIAEDYR